MRWSPGVAFGLLALAGLVAPRASVRAQLPPLPREIHHIHGLALDRRDPEVLYVIRTWRKVVMCSASFWPRARRAGRGGRS